MEASKNTLFVTPTERNLKTNLSDFLMKQTFVL